MSHEPRRPVPRVPGPRYPLVPGRSTEQPLSSASGELIGLASSEQRGADLRVWVEDVAGDALVVHVGGEVDLSTAPTLDEGLMCVCARADRQRVRADLRDVAFLGSAGLQVLLDAHFRCRRRGVEFEVTNPPPAVLRAIRISGLDQVLSLRLPVDESDVQTQQGAG